MASLPSANAVADSIAAQLKSDTVLLFLETPLVDILEYLQEAHDIPIALDVGTKPNAQQPINVDIRACSLVTALIIVLDPLELTLEQRIVMSDFRKPDSADCFIVTIAASLIALTVLAIPLYGYTPVLVVLVGMFAGAAVANCVLD